MQPSQSPNKVQLPGTAPERSAAPCGFCLVGVGVPVGCQDSLRTMRTVDSVDRDHQ